MTVTTGGSPQQQLDYARTPSPEGLVVERRPDGVVVTVLPRRGRVVEAVGRSAGIILFAGAITGAMLYYNPPGPTGVPWTILVWPAVAVLFAAGQLVANLVTALYPGRWEVDDSKLAYTGRSLTGVVREQWPRVAIADLRVRRVRLKDQWWPRPHLVMVSPAGAQTAIDRGDRRGLAALGEILREALKLPPDPTCEDSYPPPPDGRPPRRTHRTVTQAGVWLVHRPPHISWPVVVALPVLVAAAWAVDHYYFVRPEARSAVTVSQSPAWSIFRVALLTLMPLALLCWGVYRLRRWTTVGVQWDELDLIETGLLRPCNEEWPLADVAGVEAVAAGRTGESDADEATLAILLRDGRTVTAMERKPRRDVEWVAASLRHAIGRAATAGRSLGI